MDRTPQLPRELPRLDGLRGLAALAVLVSHCANAGMLPSFLGSGLGRDGVAIFYALSGFLMAHVCFGQGVNRRTLMNYAVARGTRVLPLFYAIVIVDLLILLLAGREFYSIESFRDAVLNLALVRGDRVLWSVPVEVQFYVMFVGIWWAQSRGQLGRALLALAALSAIMVGIAVAGLWPLRDNLLPFWLHFFLIGIGLHVLFDRHYLLLQETFRGPRGWIIAILVFVGLVILPPTLRESLGQPQMPAYRDPFIIVLVPMLLCVCCAGHRLFGWLAHPVMRWFGTISYSLYLLHWPVVTIAEEIGLSEQLTPFGAFLAVIVVAISLAAISFKMVERPAQQYLREHYRAALAAQSSRLAH